MSGVTLTPELHQTIQQCGMEGLEQLQSPQHQPSSERWKLPMMWHRGNNGVIYLWQVGFDGELLRLHGPSTALTVTRRKVVPMGGKTLQEQALIEVRTKYRNKYHAGYLPLESSTPPMLKGMKGVPYQENKVKKWPLLASPKLNGVRMMVRNLGSGELQCLSYLNRSYNHLVHLHASMIGLLSYLPPQSVLDGELYCHSMSFHQITSAVKTTTKNHPHVHEIQYHIFDLVTPENQPSEVRYQILQQAFHLYSLDMRREWHIKRKNPSLAEGTTSSTAECATVNEEDIDLSHFLPQGLVLVPQQLVFNHQQVMILKAFYVSHGYEGLVLRTMANGSSQSSKEYKASLYRHGRTVNLYKVKDFIDEEGEVVDVIESMGNEEGTAGLRVKDKRNNIFTVRWGSQQEREAWLQQPSLVVGRSFTFKYTELSQYGVPQQPTGVGFRDYE